MSTASADYYIVQEKATKKCKVVETKPTETTWIQVGPAAFKTQADAEKQNMPVSMVTAGFVPSLPHPPEVRQCGHWQ
jgi:hypothetical protein